MKMHDYNTDQDRVILLIHPMMSDGAGLKLCITDYMGSDFRYLLPDLAAHGDAGGDTYHSAKEEASQIHDYLVAQGITHLAMGYCASLGACALFELLEYKDIEFDQRRQPLREYQIIVFPFQEDVSWQAFSGAQEAGKDGRDNAKNVR